MARNFTQAESNAIIKEYPLTEEVTPSLSICQKICEKHDLQNTKNKSKTIGELAKRTINNYIAVI